MESLIIGGAQVHALKLYVAGQEMCAPSHHFGPAVREHYLLHYVFSGTGRFEVGGRTYHLRAGQAFLIVPNVVTFYQADDRDPWHYAWLEFGGVQAETFLHQCGLDVEHPIYTARDAQDMQAQWMQLLEFARTDGADGYRVAGAAYLLFDLFFRQSHTPPVQAQPASAYLHQAIAYIRYHYYRPVPVAELCALVGVERSYLCRLFKAQTGKSPQRYVLDYKLDVARALLREGKLSVAQVARSVGYEDQSAFSKLYKKRYGSAPKREQGR